MAPDSVAYASLSADSISSGTSLLLFLRRFIQVVALLIMMMIKQSFAFEIYQVSDARITF